MRALKEYDKHRFRGLHPEIVSGSTLKVNRVSDDGTRIIFTAPRNMVRMSGDLFFLNLNNGTEWRFQQWQVNVMKFGVDFLIEKNYFPAALWDSFKDMASRQYETPVWWKYSRNRNSL